MRVSSGGMTQGSARQMHSRLGQDRLELEVRVGQCMQAIPLSWILDYGWLLFCDLPMLAGYPTASRGSPGPAKAEVCACIFHLSGLYFSGVMSSPIQLAAGLGDLLN